MRHFWFAALLICAGCLQPVEDDLDAGVQRDAGVIRDAGTQIQDSGVPVHDAGMAVDAGSPSCAGAAEIRDVFDGTCKPPGPGCVGDVMANKPVTLLQAQCLSLDIPACQGCHRTPCGYQATPRWAPPPPSGVNLDTSMCL